MITILRILGLSPRENSRGRRWCRWFVIGGGIRRMA